MSPLLPETDRAATLGSIVRRCVEALRRACGAPDYAAYLEHLRIRHPQQIPLDYATFFRQREQARYGGASRNRCC